MGSKIKEIIDTLDIARECYEVVLDDYEDLMIGQNFLIINSLTGKMYDLYDLVN